MHYHYEIQRRLRNSNGAGDTIAQTTTSDYAREFVTVLIGRDIFEYRVVAISEHGAIGAWMA